MRKIARWFDSHNDAEKAEQEFYFALTPMQRMKILFELRRRYYGTPKRLERVYKIVERKRS